MLAVLTLVVLILSMVAVPSFACEELSTCTEEEAVQPRSCMHRSTAIRTLYTRTKYSPYNPDHHSLKITYNTYCLDCMAIVNTSYTMQNEAHTWSSGTCTRCGEENRG